MTVLVLSRLLFLAARDYRGFQVARGSMIPTLHVNDHVVID